MYRYSETNGGLNHYLELESKMMYLTGYTFERLLELFAEGYTLTPPTCASLSELGKADEEV